MRKGIFEAAILTEVGYDGFESKELIKSRYTLGIADCIVELEHEIHYGIRLASGVKGDVTIVIDGKQVGTFRLNPHRPVVIERPVNIDKKFTFYKLGSTEAEKAGLRSDNHFLGIVQVVFIPEKQRQVYNARSFEKVVTFGEVTRGEVTRGGTGLSGKSNQVFGNAEEIELDYSKETIITFKLQSKEDDIQPIIEAYSQNINSKLRKLSRKEFRELFEKEFSLDFHNAHQRIITLCEKGVIDPDELTEYTLNKVHDYYNNGW